MGLERWITEVAIEETEFAESKGTSSGSAAQEPYGTRPESRHAPAEGQAGADGFMDIPDGIDEELPFS